MNTRKQVFEVLKTCKGGEHRKPKKAKRKSYKDSLKKAARHDLASFFSLLVSIGSRRFGIRKM